MAEPYYPSNADSIKSGRVVITVIPPGVAPAVPFYNLPDYPIPDGFSLLLTANPGNTGIIYVAQTAAETLSLDSAYPLIAGQNVGYQISNTNIIWISGTVLNDVLNWTVEQRSRRQANGNR